MRREITALLRTRGVPSYVAGFGSVFVVYFFEGQPANYNDVLKNDSQLDRSFRASLFSQGVLANPLPLKRYHLMAAHSSSDLDFTLEAMGKALRDLA
jgi:glutamate-1-semialdehyde 2,1-aminomutase